jgi:selenocysteine lyase/cysteine desulfurase
MSNVIGMPQDVAAIVGCAKQKNPNVITVVDAAQFVVHSEIDVEKWGCDFLCFSGHKIGADTGVGVLYIKNPDNYKPVFFGGGMVNKIVGGDIIYNSAPDVFEAGTLPLTQIAGLKNAIADIKKNRPDLNLIKFMYDELSKIEKIKILSGRDSALLTFVVDGMHALDFGALIGSRGVCVRIGNMCASWIHQIMGVPGSIRISVGAYNSKDEVKTVIGYIKEIIK